MKYFHLNKKWIFLKVKKLLERIVTPLIFTIKRFLQLDPVLVDEIAVVFAVPESGVSHQADDVCLQIESQFCVW